MTGKPIRRAPPWEKYTVALARDLLSKVREETRANYGSSQHTYAASTTLIGQSIDPRPKGGGVQPQNVQENLISIKQPGTARPWVVSMKGEILRYSDPNPLLVFPWTVFRVQWGIGGTRFQTFIDGYSDQFLQVFAEEVNVWAEWDRENMLVDSGPLVPMVPPLAIGMAASVCEVSGPSTLAKRSLALRQNAAAYSTSVTIPYGARNWLLRSQSGTAGNWFANLGFVNQIVADQDAAPVPFFVESLTGAEVAAQHAAQTPFPVASIANRLSFVYPVAGTPNDYASVEFQIQP